MKTAQGKFTYICPFLTNESELKLDGGWRISAKIPQILYRVDKTIIKLFQVKCYCVVLTRIPF